MHTVELLERALEFVERLGYRVRQESLGGQGGGRCEFQGRKLLFLDLDLMPSEQLEQALDALREEPDAARLQMPRELRGLLAVRKCA